MTAHQIMFHNNQLNKIKAKVKDCKYISYVRYQDAYSLKIVVGNAEPKYINLDGSPEDVTVKSYQDLLENILQYYGQA